MLTVGKGALPTETVTNTSLIPEALSFLQGGGGGPDNPGGACLSYPEADTLQWALLQVRCIHSVVEPDEPDHLS